MVEQGMVDPDTIDRQTIHLILYIYKKKDFQELLLPSLTKIPFARKIKCNENILFAIIFRPILKIAFNEDANYRFTFNFLAFFFNSSPPNRFLSRRRIRKMSESSRIVHTCRFCPAFPNERPETFLRSLENNEIEKRRKEGEEIEGRIKLMNPAHRSPLLL